jgi:hypothetical protein
MHNNGEGKFGDEPHMPFSPPFCACLKGHCGNDCFG